MIVAGDRPLVGAEELGQRRPEIGAGQAVQIQQRQHLRHPRRLPRPGRQDRRGEPAPLTAHPIDTFVVDPRRPHSHGTGRRGHLPLSMVTVADDQPATVGVNLATMDVDVGGHLGLQRRRQHLPGTVADNLIEHRRAGLVGVETSSCTTLSIRAYLPEPARQRRLLIRATGLQIILEKVRPFTSPGRGPSTDLRSC